MERRTALERPQVRWPLLVIAGLVVLHLVAWLLLLGLQRSHVDTVLSGVQVDGADVGGLARGQLAEVVDERADDRLTQTVRVTTMADGDDVAAELTTDRAELGVTVETRETADDAWAQGRRGLWRALADQLRVRLGSTLDVPLQLAIDERHLEEWSSSAAEELSVAPRDGAIELTTENDAVQVEVVEARPGTTVEPATVRDRVQQAAEEELGPVHVEVPADHAEPQLTDADVASALADAELAVSAPVELVNPSPVGDDLQLEPSDLAVVLEVAADPDAPEGERLQVTTDATRLTDHLGDDQLDALAPGPVDAQLVLSDGDVTIEDGAEGFDVDLDEAAEVVVELALREDDRSGELPGETSAPAVTTDDAEAVADDARVLVSAPVELVNPSDGDDLELSPSALAEVLAVEVVVDDDGPALEVTSSASALTDQLGDDGVDALETGAVDIQVELVDGDELSVSGGLPGYAWDADAAAEVVAALARDEDDRTGELPGETTQPDMTQQELEDLGITQIVSSFTTDLVPGQPRNTNIQLAADYLDGSLIQPGDTFSLNQGIGQRTADRGFVENGFIEDGEVISVTGGGVSQMGTTFVNAAWFAGIQIPEFHPHSLYFARYPMGREATLAWGTLDVVVENDSPHAIMVLTSHTESSVTVAFASTEWAEVDTWSGDPYDVVEGTERNGFTIDFGRDITYPDGTTSSESYTHTYEPEDA